MKALPRLTKMMKHPADSPIEPVIKIRRGHGKLNSWTLTTAVLVVCVLLWQAVSKAGIFPSFALPSPVAVWQAFVDIIHNGYGGQSLLSDILVSCFRIVIGFVGAILIGVPVGLLMSRNKFVFDIIDPLLQFVRPVPPLAYIPLLVVWFGIGELPKAILILVGTIPVIIIGTMSGVKSTPALRISVARTLGATNAQIFRKVVLPSAMPEIFTSMRVGIGVAWTCLVAAELIAASSGLGWLVQFAGQALQVAIVIVGIVIIGLIGYAMELAIRKIENIVVPWRGHN
ncbi:Putative aliphatic sulfonates transport permease protein SsuC [Paraburkholderia caffeinitolerans]|uniref:Aliphatic sulfonates transport permease protein SsuC n=1 Tax=Paraburkholderia caffeinitolerans TaxID=1723730 RepID=A0A6J5GFY1_9BURK|nr:ABC transporter permease [Paraburkholderia caffeinitolerans]CAB3800035.1 Putative aliphatic sulfonates transport permease protein SsuC [Paraburkholderia caffeinitolerans]